MSAMDETQIEWPDWNQIPESTFQLLRQNYESHGFCFETRINLPDFIQNNFITEEVDIQTAVSVALKLLEELSTYIQSMPNTPYLLPIKRILQATHNKLQVCSINLKEPGLFGQLYFRNFRL